MSKASRQYLADLRDIRETLLRLREKITRFVDSHSEAKWVEITTGERERMRELLRICEEEIERVERELGEREKL